MNEDTLYEKGRSAQKQKAFDLFLESNGTIPLKQIAESIGISPRTAQRWAKKDNWKGRLSGSNDANISDNSIKNEQLKKLNEKDEIVDSAENLRFFLFCINEKISSQSESLYQMKLDELLKVTTNFAKAISEAIKTLEEAKPLVAKEMEQEDLNWLQKKIANNSDLLDLASKLLSKLSD